MGHRGHRSGGLRGGRQRQEGCGHVGPTEQSNQQKDDVPCHEPQGPESYKLDPPQAPA